MDKLRRWLIDLGNGGNRYVSKQVFSSDITECDDEGEVPNLAEPVSPYDKCRNKSIEEYVREVHRGDYENRKRMPDSVCEECFERWKCEFMVERLFEMDDALKSYREEKSKAVFGESMEYLRMKQREALWRVVESSCVEKSHLKIKDNAETMEGYRVELGMSVGDEERLRKYAFFRRFFSYENSRYVLTKKSMMARHLYLNLGEGDREAVMQWFGEFSMLVYMEMDVKSARDGQRLMDIKSFDPFAVLETVDRIAQYASDKERVRGIWVELMLRSSEIVRKHGRGIRECFSPTKKRETFGWRFVMAVAGKMQRQWWYDATYMELAYALENGGRGIETTLVYLETPLGKMKVLTDSIDVVNGVVGVFKKI